MGMVDGKLECREYDACPRRCPECGILSDKKRKKAVRLDAPKPCASVGRKGPAHTGLDECPACGNSVGCHPKGEPFRCPRCNQLISREEDKL